MRRSLLFIPGNAPNLIGNSDILGADALIFDLEDAVSPDEKDAARILVRNTLQSMDFSSTEVVIRINAVDTAYWKDDLAVLTPMKPMSFMLPKSGTAADIELVDGELTRLEQENGLEPGTVGIIPLIETALGLENSFAIASASPRVIGMLLGAEDLTADLHCKRTKGGMEIAYARGRLVCAARATY